MLMAFPLMFLAGWMAAFAAPLPLPPGPLDTNIFNTNGLVIPPEVQFLLRDLQTNLNQVTPFLAIINGTNQADADKNILPPAPPAVSSNPSPADTNNAPLIYGLGAALENVQTDLQELLPRLAAMVGQTNYTSNSVSTNSNLPVPNRLEPIDQIPARSPQIQRTSVEIGAGNRSLPTALP
jgi:hypothetical protein